MARACGLNVGTNLMMTAFNLHFGKTSCNVLCPLGEQKRV